MLFAKENKFELLMEMLVKKSNINRITVKYAPMDHRPPNWTAYIAPYLTLILVNIAFKYPTKVWLII